MVNSDTAIHLSVVATSRNDNHGGSLTRRMQHFVDGFVAQCKRHHLRAELIIVEWNPPEDRKPLAEELKWPEHLGPCEIRIITVPPEIHRTFRHHEKLPLFQMIAKNVGIRRARGKFILATNIDILFSDEVVRLMRDSLRSGRLYRAPRCDVPQAVPLSPSFDDVLTYCDREMFRINANGVTAVREGSAWPATKLTWLRLDPRLRWMLYLLSDRGPKQLLVLLVSTWRLVLRVLAYLPRVIHRARSFWSVLDALIYGSLRQRGDRAGRYSIVRRIRLATSRYFEIFLERLIRPWPFTNACGDFTLLSADDWLRLRGYPEWHIFSWHLDSLLLYQARASGFREVDLGLDARIFHIEHEAGSGYTPEGADKLFNRLKLSGVSFLTFDDLVRLTQEMYNAGRMKGEVVTYNPVTWGLCGLNLPEISIRHCRASISAENSPSLLTL